MAAQGRRRRLTPHRKNVLIDARISLHGTTVEAWQQAVEIRDAEAARLERLLGPHELILVGGRSIVGALTRGDVDLHLRVPPGDFESSVAVLRATCRIVHPEIWQSTLATFEVDGDVDVGIAVTPAGSEHDLRFTHAWARLASDGALLERYNAMKLASTAGDYEERKARFFDDLEGDAWGT